MKILLDTQAFPWFILNDSALSQNACDLIVDPLNEILLSPASYWEKLPSRLVLASIRFLAAFKHGWKIKSKLTNLKYYPLMHLITAQQSPIGMSIRLF